MDVIQQNINLITKRLSYLQTEIKNAVSLNLTDINIHAENFYLELFNLLGYNFVNTNSNKQNYAYIDLIDTNNKLAIQVTSQNDSKKIQEAIDGFYATNSNSNFKLKLLLISKDAKSYKKAFGSNFNHEEDVIDIPRLLKIITNKRADEITTIANFLDKTILTERHKTESTEVETIMSLIDFLSKDNNRLISNNVNNVDPENKVYNRFSVHSEYIVEQYQTLFSVYNIALLEARKKIDSVNAILISEYLKDESDQILSNENNNPKSALVTLVEYFYNKLSNNGFVFDKMAIKFYLLDELIKCNVFPNK